MTEDKVDISKEYNKIKGLPKFEDLNNDFEVEFFKEKQFLTRQIRRKMNEKVMEIYKKEKKMKLVNRFLKPGDDLDVWLNWARTVCRRAERRMVSLNKVEKNDKNILIFINRLSDYLFILSRRLKS